MERRAGPGVRVSARRARSLPPQLVLVEDHRVRGDLVLLPGHDAETAPERAGSRSPTHAAVGLRVGHPARAAPRPRGSLADRKSTRLNSSHMSISYAVFGLK